MGFPPVLQKRLLAGNLSFSTQVVRDRTSDSESCTPATYLVPELPPQSPCHLSLSVLCLYDEGEAGAGMRQVSVDSGEEEGRMKI